ncbi:apolipoprotein N-acyltransferase [Vogesella sp. LIG4]|uniref:apolipoprotein N-acyltransferase n=1 Tax=Vogesella sp. LIG4 TaxID=1192162 RepID=UPI00081FCF3A|nr:apolipoprotein N-acyltransferase [Vogesella sp. LIG4]SCK10020.1 apolipoprotein N-acyltransferase [Vogesella sp. LIG4]
MLLQLAWLLLTIGSGAATVLAYAPYRLFFLMPLCLATLLWLVQRWPQRAFTTAWLWGLTAYCSQFYWIYISLHDIAGLPSPLAGGMTLLLPAYLALYPALACHLTVRIHSHGWVRHLLLFPAAWTVGEWLRSWMLTGFPWGAAGYSQITESPLAGYAPLGGIHLVTFAVALSASLLAWLPQLPRKGMLSGLLAIALLWGGGDLAKRQQWTQDSGKPLTVSLLQGNIPQALKWDPATFEFTLATYYRMVAQAPASQLLLLPETALPVFLDDMPSGYLTMINGAADLKNSALITGLPRRTPDGRGYLNAVVALNQPQFPYYAKDHLVPFGEFIPLPMITSWIYQFMNMPLSGFSRGGPMQHPLQVADQRIAFNVCYEDGFGEELIGPAANATMLANVSNLAWFGKSNAMSQHLQLSQARALETGRAMLRSTNTGMTAVIDHRGEVVAVAAPDTRQTISATVQGRSGLTPYMQTGNLPILALCAALLLIAAGLGLWQRQQQRTALEH